MKTQLYLFVGGTLDGHWFHVEEDRAYVNVPDYGNQSSSEGLTANSVANFRVQIYRRSPWTVDQTRHDIFVFDLTPKEVWTRLLSTYAAAKAPLSDTEAGIVFMESNIPKLITEGVKVRPEHWFQYAQAIAKYIAQRQLP